MISIVIPVYNEEKSLEPLTQKLRDVLNRQNQNYEIIYIDDGSTDRSFYELQNLYQQNPDHLKIIQFTKNFEKAAALMAGLNQAQGEIVFTMDGDLQDDPEEISNFLKKIGEGYDCVVGWKAKRYDPLSKTLPSKLFNYFVSRISKVKIHDFNCGFKAFTKEAADSLNLYGGLYRFIPALLGDKGFKITEIPVKHHRRKFGKSKYGFGRFVKGFFDIITLSVLIKFSQRPAHFFGNFGVLSSLIGLAVIIGLYIAKFVFQILISERPYFFFLGLLLVIVGVQLISIGFLGEIIISNRSINKDHYRIKNILK